MTLIKTAVDALKWSMLGEIGSRLIGPILFIVLARILLPEDLGVVAAAMVAISFSNVFWDSGLARALVQRPDDEPAFAEVAVLVNLALGCVLMLLIIVAAPAVAGFFKDERIAAVLRVLSLQLPLAAICSVFTALMQKRLEFRSLFMVRVITTGVPGVASIPLAIAGWGYWAIVAAALVGQCLQLAVLWRIALTPIRPRFDAPRAGQLLRFGRWSIASGLLGWVYGWLDAIIVGHFLGTHDMGLYRTGNTFVTVVFGLAFAPLLPVLYSTFSRVQHDLNLLRRALPVVAHAICLVSLPIGFALVAFGEDLGLMVFGPEWSGVGLVIGFLGLAHAVGWIVGANGELYRAIGRPQVETLVMTLMLVCYVPVYLLAIQDGLETFLWARLALSVLAVVAHILTCRWAVGIGFKHWIRAGAWAVPCAALATWIPMHVPLHGYPAASRVLFTACLGACVYVACIVVLERRFLRQVMGIVRGRSEPYMRGGENTC